MYVYCVYSAMSKVQSKRQILLERAETRVVLIEFNVLCYVRAYTVAVSHRLLYMNHTRKALLCPCLK